MWHLNTQYMIRVCTLEIMISFAFSGTWAQTCCHRLPRGKTDENDKNVAGVCKPGCVYTVTCFLHTQSPFWGVKESFVSGLVQQSSRFGACLTLGDP